MKARISSKGRAFLKNPKAAYAMLEAMIANQDAFLDGEPISFAVASRHNGGRPTEQKFTVRLAEAANNNQ